MGTEALAEALRALANTLRFYREMGVTDLPLSRDYLPGPRDALKDLERQIDGCTRCKLCQGRTTIVFGSGNPNADLMVIGEAPGAEEDVQGKPFVGRAGQLLTRMLQSVGWSRDDEVFITNIVKCFISPRVLIYTAQGYKPIKDIRVGDLVLTHQGRFRNVVYVRPREVLPKGSPVIRISIRAVEGNRRPVHMTVTPEHPFLVDGVWKPASEIKSGDQIKTLGDQCEVCGRAYFVRYDRYERRTYRTCSYRCHNLRIFHNPEARQKVRLAMKAQYASGRRDPNLITRRANERTRELVAAGLAKIQHLTSGERYRSRLALARNITAGLRRARTGFGEEELKQILNHLEVPYIHLFALPDSAFVYDFCLPAHKMLIEVRGPGFLNRAAQERAIAKERLAREHGYLVLNLWWSQIVDQPRSVEEILGRIVKNHAGEYVFVDAVVTRVESHRTGRDFPLYNIGVEEDESYVAAGLVSHNCRPPQNRNPEPDEIASCEPFLLGQLRAIQPKVILALGTFAAQTLLKTREPIGKLRGRVHAYGSVVLVPTFHPAFLLRNPGPEYRRLAWEDMKLARREYDRLRGGSSST